MFIESGFWGQLQILWLKKTFLCVVAMVFVTYFSIADTSTRMDNIGGEGGKYFCNSSDVCYCIEVFGAKKSNAKIRVMVMGFYFILSDVEGCAAASGVINKGGYSFGCGENDGDGGGLRPIFFHICRVEISDGKIQVMVMGFSSVFSDVEGCAAASGVGNKDG